MDWSESTHSEQMAMRLARSGALIRLVCADDACDVCRSLAGKTFAPADAPRLPVRGCRNETCRCRFLVVDPQSKRTTPELVQAGVEAIRRREYRQARQLLRRVTALDEMDEQGWLWLSGVVDDDEKIICLEKVLAINPRNKRAQAGLAYLRKKRPAQKAPPETSSTPTAGAVAEKPTLPPQVIQLRRERQVIVEEWGDFMNIAVETDPQMLLMQGGAFLKQLGRLDDQVLAMLPEGKQLDELLLQWQESEMIGESLADLLHDPGHRNQPGWEEMHASLRKLAQSLLAHRQSLRERIAQAGGKTPSSPAGK